MESTEEGELSMITYKVMLMDGINGYILMETEDIEKARNRAKDEIYYIERDKRKNDFVEIWKCENGIDYAEVEF